MGTCSECGQEDLRIVATEYVCDKCQPGLTAFAKKMAEASRPALRAMERQEQDMTADEALAAINDGYEALRDEFVAAVEQASGGKGKERHANDQPFDQQPILAITRLLDGHPCAALAYQIIKKTIEAGRLVRLRGTDAAVAETYGVMNYAGAMAIRLKELGEVRHG